MSAILEWLFEGVGSDPFFQEYWGKKPLHLKRTPGHYADLVSQKELLEQSFAGQIPYPGLMVRKHGRNLWDGVLRADKTYDEQVLRRCHADGLTFRYRHVEQQTKMMPTVKALQEHIGGQCTFVCAWLAPAPSEHWVHYDALEAIILQIEGEKVWRLYESPLAGQKSFDGNQTAYGAVTAEYTLTPGDLLYVPRGVFHSAAAASHSLHLVIPHDALTGGELVLALAQESLRANPAFWHNLPVDWRTNPATGELLSRVLDEMGKDSAALLPQVQPVTSMETIEV